jgi:hypothetical protein
MISPARSASFPARKRSDEKICSDNLILNPNVFKKLMPSSRALFK